MENREPRRVSSSHDVFAPVPGPNSFEETVERLLRSIRLGVLAEGDCLPPERELAAMFGISRVTLRDVIAALRNAGLVESVRGRTGGTFVVGSPIASEGDPHNRFGSRAAEELEEVLALRLVVEPGAAALAAGQPLAAHDRSNVLACLEDASGAEPNRRQSADRRLHCTIAALGGSVLVAAAVADVRMRLESALDVIPSIPANVVHSDRQHAAIVYAILAGDVSKARKEMEEHVEGTAALLRGFLS